MARDQCVTGWHQVTGVVEVASSASKSACVATVWMGMLTQASAAVAAAQPYHADQAWQSMQKSPLRTRASPISRPDVVVQTARRYRPVVPGAKTQSVECLRLHNLLCDGGCLTGCVEC